MWSMRSHLPSYLMVPMPRRKRSICRGSKAGSNSRNTGLSGVSLKSPPAMILSMPMTASASDSSSGDIDRPADKVGAPSARARMRILRIPILLTRDTVHSGEKPLRTYTGPRHTGGVSDHLPVLLEVSMPP